MANYQEARVELKIYPIKEIKISRLLNKKNFEEELPQELFLTRRQTTKMWNPFANNMSTDIKLSETQIFKIIQSGRSFEKH